MAEQVAERLHDIEAVMERLNLGRSKVFELIANRQLRSIKVGRRRLVSESALVQCITNLDQPALLAAAETSADGSVLPATAGDEAQGGEQ